MNVKIGDTRTGDVFDYSTNRKASVRITSGDKKHFAIVNFSQNPRTAGLYRIKAGVNDPIPQLPPTDPDYDPDYNPVRASRIGQLIMSENVSMRNTMDKVVIQNAEGEEVELTDEDLKAIIELVPMLGTVDLSEATLETMPANIFTNHPTLEFLMLPEGLTEIEAQAFKGCLSLDRVNLPSTLTTIGAQAFMYAPLDGNYLVIPRSLQTMGTMAFAGCVGLKGLSFEEPDAETIKGSTETFVIPDYAFACPMPIVGVTNVNSMVPGYNTTAAPAPAQATVGGSLDSDLRIPNWVSKIGLGAFLGLSYRSTESTLKLTIGKNVDEMKQGVFFMNKGVTEMVFDAGKDIDIVTTNASSSLQYESHFGGTSITTLTYPMSPRLPQTVIPTHMFGNCTDLVSVTIGNSVEIIQGYVFHKCGISDNITFGTGLTTIGDNVFSQAVEMPATIDMDTSPNLTTIGAFTFSQSPITNVKLPSALTSLGMYTFSDGSGPSATSILKAENIDLSNLVNLTTIPANTFLFYRALKSVKFSNAVTGFGTSLPTNTTYNTFAGCTALETIWFPESRNPGDATSNPIGVTIHNNVWGVNSYGTTGYVIPRVPISYY
jgi:hypothetical protein